MYTWDKIRVLVTGATGFIGSWLTEFLVEKNAEVTVLVKPNDPLGLGGITHLKEKINIVFGDLRDSKQVSSAVKGREIIFHLGAQTQVLDSITCPQESVEVNILGTFNVLEAARTNELTQFLIYSSTDKVYGEPQYLPIDENHPLGVVSPYDASKLGGDLLLTSFQKTYGLSSSTIRWSNTIGGRDSNLLRIVPDLVTSLLHGKTPTIRGDGTHIRDYMYVEDAINGIIKVAENQSITKHKVYNLGTEKPTSVIDLTNLIINMMGYSDKIKPIILGRESKGEIKKQFLSSKRANQELDWYPKYSLENSIKKTIDWYKDHPEWYVTMERVASQK